MSADRDALVERVAAAIWGTYTVSKVAKPTLRGITWDDLTRWAGTSAKIAEVRELALSEARAALAAISTTHVIGPRELPASVRGMRLAVDEISAEGIWRKVVGLMEADHG